jgi:hypothetical protein
MSRYALFDRRQIALEPLQRRGHELSIERVLPLSSDVPAFDHPDFQQLIQALVQARNDGRPVIAMIGGHPIKLGLSRFLVDLIQRRLITHLATNGSGIIHDFELACYGGTSEDVTKWIAVGQFGLWRETGRLNEIVSEAARCGEGIGEAVGRVIEDHRYPHRDVSVCAAGWRAGVPVTSHIGVGSDIIHAHANCEGAALGAASYTDFLIFAESIRRLEGGVFLNIGSAVTGPEVYLKALSMARNVARQSGREIRHFTTAVFDLVPLPRDCRARVPGKAHALYYYRPWKTILMRTVADGGRSFYFCGDHRLTIPALWQQLTRHVDEGECEGAGLVRKRA